MANHATVTADYLSRTQGVLDAARRLQASLGAEPETRDFAVTRLERAAAAHTEGTSGFLQFMYQAAPAAAAEASAAARGRTDEDFLAAVLTDIQVGNVLIASGERLGEAAQRPGEPPPPPTGPGKPPTEPAAPRPPTGPGALDEAIVQLESTTVTLERTLPAPLGQPRVFGFTGPEAARAAASPDLPTAVTTFRNHSGAALGTIVAESSTAVTAVVSEVAKLGYDKMGEALGKLGEQFEPLKSVGRLIKLGIQKITAAINWLVQWLGKEFLAKVKEPIQKFWEKVKNGEFVPSLLGALFQVKEAREEIEGILGGQGLKREGVDAGSTDLDTLEARFKDQMALLRKMAIGVALSGWLFSLIPAVGGYALLVAAFLDALILAAVVLIGMDYADAGNLIQRVRGVREIARGLRS